MWSQISSRHCVGPVLIFQLSSLGSRATNVLGLDFRFSDCLDIVNASPLWQQQGIHGILVPVNQYLSCRFQRVSSIRLIACMCTLCVGCPQMCFLSARHKGDPRRGHLAWQHKLKAEERRLFFPVVVIKIIVSWVPPTEKCYVVQMPPIISHQCPAILKWQRWL